MIDYKINNPLSEAEYIAHAAIVCALKPIQLSSEKHCSRDVKLASAEAVLLSSLRNFMNKTVSSLKLKDALISRLNKRTQKNTNRVSKIHKNGKCIRSSGHSDTNLEALPAKNVLLSAAKQLLIHFYDENGDEMFALSDSEEEGVSQSQSVVPDQSQKAMLFDKLEGAIKKKQSASLKQPKQVGQLAGA